MNVKAHIDGAAPHLSIIAETGAEGFELRAVYETLKAAGYDVGYGVQDNDKDIELRITISK